MLRFFIFMSGGFLAFYALAFNDTTRTTPNTPVDTNNRDFENIRATEFVNLDSFEAGGSVAGLRLQCNPGETRAGGARFVSASGDPTITFCEDECGERPTPNSQGPTTSIECANYLDQYIRECVEAIGCVSDVQFCGVGGHAKRYKNTGEENSSPSRHSSGDALDLFGIKCRRRAPGGNGYQNFQMDFSSQGRQQNTKEYDDFVACWRTKMESCQPRASGHRGAISCQGSEEPNNDLHNDHVHLSCPTPRNNTGGT